VTTTKRSRTRTPTPLRVGDRVEWSSHGSTARGRVVGKLSAPTDIQGHHVAASPREPQYLVRSDRSGGIAAHKRGALRKRPA
jgi:Hypervirulence associated proteins TUDOR domain